MKGRLNIIRIMVEYISKSEEISIDTPDLRGYTMLTHAVQYNNVDVFSYLLRKGADFTVKDDCNHSLLHWAAYKGSDLIAIMLLNRNVEIGFSSHSYNCFFRLFG